MINLAAQATGIRFLWVNISYWGNRSGYTVIHLYLWSKSLWDIKTLCLWMLLTSREGVSVYRIISLLLVQSPCLMVQSPFLQIVFSTFRETVDGLASVLPAPGLASVLPASTRIGSGAAPKEWTPRQRALALQRALGVPNDYDSKPCQPTMWAPNAMMNYYFVGLYIISFQTFGFRGKVSTMGG
jgi:hypothetical protein